MAQKNIKIASPDSLGTGLANLKRRVSLLTNQEVKITEDKRFHVFFTTRKEGAMRIVIIEDEKIAYEKLVSFVREVVKPDALSWVRSIQEGRTFFETNQVVDVIFSDIELLDGPVFELFKIVTPACPIVFCTAYDQFYVDAFATNGIAYLLKPYSQEQFVEAWNKYLLLFGVKQSG